MDYLGDKLTVAHSHLTGWVGNVRRSLQGALSAVGGPRGDDGGGFKRTNSLRSLASRSRESFRRFSLRSQQRLSLRRRTTAPNTPTAVKLQHQGSGEEELKDPDTLVQESDSQYGTWETGLHTDDSLTPATPTSDGALSPSPGKPSPSHTPAHHGLPSELDGSAGLSPTTPAESQQLSLPEVSTVLLDTSVLRSRAQLGKRRAPRSRPTRTAPPQGEGGATDDWRFRDSTDEKPEFKEDPEEQTREVEPRSTTNAVSQPQRIPLFPGMDPSALKSQLKKRADSDNLVDVGTPSPSQLSRSPKSPFLPRATRVLPPSGGRENGLEDSPQWLKELKSKKRLSQYDYDDSK
uniref:Tankyrase 1-binding protein C-terminal domain-containing protein n=1 Tax=Gadus morhua TaxID=8049 RepID=A0A8C4YV26_GADMO